jgi:glycosyltransferase involved in cell wall biosynthesis
LRPQVSIILPVHNAGAFLQPAVASILGQSLSDFELLLIDDHSSDGAVQSLDQGDPRLQVISSPARGVVAAFNAGFAAASGRYIARMDADDLAEPDRLGSQVELLRQDEGLGIVGACVDFFAASGVGEGNRRYRDWLNSLRTPAQIRRAMFIESPIPNPTAMFRRRVLEELGGYRDCEWPEDYDLFLRADAAGIRMAKPAGVLLHWRDHADRLTRTDPRYSLLQFQRAKAHFLVASRLPAKDIVIWGAGPTGKQMFDLLGAEGLVADGFIDVHPRRIGGKKRGKPVWPLKAALREDIFVLVAVGARSAREKIRDFLSAHERSEGRDYLFVA